MTLEKAFGEELRKAREKAGLSQEKLGFESGYHPTYISQLERGLKSPTLKAIFSLAKALGVRPSSLLKNVEARVK
jgi:transcriptional regulator with XRE-family HTH domain